MRCPWNLIGVFACMVVLLALQEGCRGCKRSKSEEVLREAKAIRIVGLDAHRAGDAETAIDMYAQAEKLLQPLAVSESPLAKEAHAYLEACQIDREAAESAKGVVGAILHYSSQTVEADWEMFVDFRSASKSVLGDDVWASLTPEMQDRVVSVLRQGSLQFFGNNLRFAGSQHRITADEVTGDHATVRVSTKVAGKEVDSVCRLIRVGTVWKFYDGECETLNAGYCQYLRKTFEVIQSERSLAQFLEDQDRTAIFDRAWGKASGELSDRFDKSYQGQMVTVVAPEGAQIVSGNKLLGMAPTGTQFKVLQERDGQWLLMSYQEGATATAGWVKKELVALVKEQGQE